MLQKEIDQALLKRAAKVFGSEGSALEWLQTPLAAFDGKSPLEKLNMAVGIEQVYDLLGRIEYGVYS